MFGQKSMKYLKELGAISQAGEGLTRICLTQEHKESIALIKRWMEEALLDVELDPIGNVIGIYKSKNENAKNLVIASHQDSVHSGGIFDGMLGIIVPLIGLDYALKNNKEYPFNIKLIAFGEEEGTRFGFPYLGSKYFAGILTNEELDYKDDDGITISEAVDDFGLDSTKLRDLKLREDIDSYLEFHIEQGPVLENKDLPVGIVTSIVAMKGYDITIYGKSGHAGTLPMEMRKDAGCGAFEICLEIEKLAQEIEDLVGTVGKMQVKPNGSNVVVNEAKFSLDIRSTSDEILDDAEELILQKIDEICKRRNLTYKVDKLFKSNSTPCSVNMLECIEKSFVDLDLEPFKLYSGAGHDAQEMAKISDMGMVFVRCIDGISHNPYEDVHMEDLDIACKLFLQILDNFS